MLFQDLPPDTSAYMFAGYAVFLLIGVIYVLSLAVRRRNLEQDLKTLESIRAEGKSGPSRSAAGATSPRPARSSRRSATSRKPARRKAANRR